MTTHKHNCAIILNTDTHPSLVDCTCGAEQAKAHLTTPREIALFETSGKQAGEAGHTPGPWKVTRATEGIVFVDLDKAQRKDGLWRFMFRGDYAFTEATTLAKYLNALKERNVALVGALEDAIPYINRVSTDPNADPWHIETATKIMGRIRAALAGEA